MKMAGLKIDLSTQLLATIADRLAYLFWGQCQQGKRGLKPKSILDILTSEAKASPHETFASREDFEARWRELGGNHG